MRKEDEYVGKRAMMIEEEKRKTDVKMDGQHQE